MSSRPQIVTCNDLDESIEQYKNLGYRLDMIFPADAPREALVSRGGESLRLQLENHPVGETPPPLVLARVGPSQCETPRKEGSWAEGRAGMEYRDLIPDRMGGKVIASHIRLPKGGEVDDYVHYHKIDFQMIYCVMGRIRVVYEDQGPPFWLTPGDLVLQPPEIRHRVLECTGGAEVIEVTMPAEHETWVEHEMTLPTDEKKPDRAFKGQRFARHIAEDNQTDSRRDLGIRAATDGQYDAFVKRLQPGEELPTSDANGQYFFRVSDSEALVIVL